MGCCSAKVKKWNQPLNPHLRVAELAAARKARAMLTTQAFIAILLMCLTRALETHCPRNEGCLLCAEVVRRDQEVVAVFASG